MRVVTFRDTLGLALRNLGQAKLRTSLTTLGVSIGIASLAGMVSLGVGLEDQLVGRFTKSGMFDSINVMPGSVGQITFGPGGRGRGGGRRGFGRNAAAAQTSRRTRASSTDEALTELAAMARRQGRLPDPARAGRGQVRRRVRVLARGRRADGASRAKARSRRSRTAGSSTSDTETACMLSLDFAKRMNEQTPGSAGRAGADAELRARRPAAPMQRADMKCPIVGIVERETGPFAGAGGRRRR